MLFFGIKCFSQSFLGRVIKQVNFKEDAGKDYPIISLLKVGTQLSIVSLETKNEFYNIIDIASDKDDYIHKSLVKFGQEIEKNVQGMFVQSRQTENYNPEIEMDNNTILTLTLKLNIETYAIALQQKKTILMSSGINKYRALATFIISKYWHRLYVEL